jgi:N-acetylglutamate synthase-like GNAT family acetyltransferase
MTIINIKEQPHYKSRAIKYFQDKWASENNNMVYEDCITRSLATENPLPVWYLLLDGDRIVGCAGLVTNDFISCMDLYPWLCALYIEESCRGKSLGKLLITRIKNDTAKRGFPKLYLSTSHIGYYEKFCFKYIGMGYHPWGESSRVYECEV